MIVGMKANSSGKDYKHSAQEEGRAKTSGKKSKCNFLGKGLSGWKKKKTKQLEGASTFSWVNKKKENEGFTEPLMERVGRKSSGAMHQLLV